MSASMLLLPRRERGYGWLVAAAAIGAIVGAGLQHGNPGGVWSWLHWICKPLATGLVLVWVWRLPAVLSPRYRRWILAGIVSSLCGDVFLMLPWDLFVPGLLAFLVGHLCFIMALLGDSRFGTPPGGLLVCMGYGALSLYLLWGGIAAPLRGPVLAYVVVLTCMGGQALVRAQSLRGTVQGHHAMLAAAGALMFMLSDSMLAWNRFRGPLPLAALWVLATYFLSLWLIARSVQRAAASPPG